MTALWAGGPEGLPLGVGTWAWGDRGYWGYGRDFSSADVAAAYAASREAGLTLFDTAEVYGRGTSEELLGGLIADRSDAAAVAVATKFAALPWRVARRGPLLAALEASLRRLGQPRVALYQIHWPLPLGSRAWLLDLAAGVQQGLVGAVGVSNYGPGQLRAAHRVLADQGVPLATNQVEYSLLARRPERSGLVDLCRELDVRIIAYSPLAQGLLTGKYSERRPPAGVRGLRYRRQLRTIEPLVRRLGEIGADHDGRTPAQVALNWLVQRGTVPIPGAKTAEQARLNAGGVGWSLTDTEVAELSRLTG
jgi:aryl-alcohol dehydrogenase-like predicted oxidoreductase